MGSFISELEREPLERLITDAQAEPRDNSAAMNEVVRRFERTATAIAASLSPCFQLRQDLKQVQLIAIVSAVRHHDGRPGFASYCRRYMGGAAKRELNRSRTAHISLSDEDVTGVGAKLAAPPIELGVQSWGGVALVVSALTPRQQELLRQRYIDDQPLKVIAATEHTSVAAVSQRLATAHRAVAALLAA